MNQSGGGSGPKDAELCGVCGGDGVLENAWGQRTRCPSCHGNGRRREDTGFHDVTKTKPSHHQGSNRAPVAEKQTWPSTPAGDQLAKEIRDAAGLSADKKAQLTREIIEYEASHGSCTKTFITKIKKQLRAG